MGVKATPPNPFTRLSREQRLASEEHHNQIRRRIAAQKKLNRERVNAEQKWEADKTTRTPELDAESAARLARDPDKYAEKQPNNRRFKRSWTDDNYVRVYGSRPSLRETGPRPYDVDLQD